MTRQPFGGGLLASPAQCAVFHPLRNSTASRACRCRFQEPALHQSGAQTTEPRMHLGGAGPWLGNPAVDETL